MPTPLTSDHTLFNDCINEFRPTPDEHNSLPQATTYSILMMPFEITTQWGLPNCTVHPSVKTKLPGPYSAFISKVDNPQWCNTQTPHLFGNALASIFTFVTGRPCKSPRDGYLCFGDFNDNIARSASEMAMAYPVLTAGPGAAHSQLPEQLLQNYHAEIESTINYLQSIPYKSYTIAMQAIRLIHLSLCNKREDYGLAYLLIASAIETVAQVAIPKKEFSTKHHCEPTWKKLAQEDPAVAELLHSFEEARGKNGHITQRYVKFIMDFAPPSTWENLVRHQHQDLVDTILRTNINYPVAHMLRKESYEVYPSELDETSITKLISDSYKYRSNFAHQGQQPPHKTSLQSYRFFEPQVRYDNNEIIQTQLMTYELLVGIAKLSISNWLSSVKVKPLSKHNPK